MIIERVKNILIFGIKGVAMANLALILTKMGKTVYGWDVKQDFITKPVLDSLPIKIFTGKQLTNTHISKIQLIIYSAAHQGNKNILLKQFSPSIPRLHQAEVLGMIMKKFSKPIAIAGSHGKTTTSSLLAYSLIKLKQRPSYLVGSSGFNQYFGGDFYPPSKTKYFICEADEYALNPPYDLKPKFYYLRPKIVIATNIDFDHPDVYLNLNEVKKAFLNFFNKRKIIACGDNLILRNALNKIERKKYYLYGFNQKNDYQIKNWLINENEAKFELYFHHKKIDVFSLKIFGLMNISNATAVAIILNHLGFSWDKIKKTIKNFTGAKRRFEEIYRYKKTILFDDYAHHPQEIQKTIEAARLRFPKRRIIIIFQPHTYSRTKALLAEFSQAIGKADLGLILPIFPSARETNLKNKISSEKIVSLNKKKLYYISNKNALKKKLKKFLIPGDIIFTMGAGDVYQLKETIIPIIKSIR